MSEYRYGHEPLPGACKDVVELGRLLSVDFDGEPLVDPTEAAVRAHIESLRDRPATGPLVLAWSGHGLVLGHDLRLAASDTQYLSGGMSINELTLMLVESGANQLLLVVDVCFAGDGALPALDAALSMVTKRSPTDGPVWVGVLASCQPSAGSYDGLLGRRLRKLISRGPHNAESKLLWSTHNRRITGHALVDALLKDWDVTAQKPLFTNLGPTISMLANPLYRGQDTEHVVEHLLRAERGDGQAVDTTFTSRAYEVETLRSWRRAARPGVRVVAGAPGTGKSALLAHVFAGTLVPARGLTTERLAELLDGSLVARGILAPTTEVPTASRLLARIQEASGSPVIVVDGLDEAGTEAYPMAEDLLAPLGGYASVVVSTRRIAEHRTGRTVVGVLHPVDVLDLDEPERRRAAMADLRRYLVTRLAGRSSEMDPDVVAEHLVAAAARDDAQPFLLARVVADQLIAHPIDTAQPQWQAGIHRSIRAAFEADLADVETTRHLPVGVTPALLARHLLATLAWGYGTGFPKEEWTVVAHATGPPGVAITGDDIAGVLATLGRYVVQDGEDGVATYRLANQGLADLMSPRSDGDEPFDLRAQVVAAALLDRYRRLVSGGIAAREATYLWRYAWRHVVEAGPGVLRTLEDLARDDRTLRSRLALAELGVANKLRATGRRPDSVPHAERAVDAYRDLPAHRAHLAAALTDLAGAYRDVGRHDSALAATREAIGLYEKLQTDDPGVVPELSIAVNNLGVYLREAGCPVEAVAVGGRAVQLYRGLTAAGPGHEAGLAMALTNLSVSQRELGRDGEALTAAREAVELYTGDPAYRAHLANALTNLSACHRDLGQPQEALAAAGQATALYRDATGTDAIFRPNLGTALTNLALCHRDLGRRAEALAAAQEATELYRLATAAEPVFRANLGDALTVLSACLGDLGQHHDALAAAQDAVRQCRPAARDNPADRTGLAAALGQLGLCCEATGDDWNALGALDESVSTYRASTPDAVPARRLAAALDRLGAARWRAGQVTEAVDCAREAVALYREAGTATAGLAGTLTNLGVASHSAGLMDEAEAATEDAVDLYRDLAAVQGDPSRLAAALSNVSAIRHAAGRDTGAAEAAEEAVRLYRTLDRPDLCDQLATALDNLGAAYFGTRRVAEAVHAAESAIALLRAQSAPAELAGALHNAGVYYHALDRSDEALTSVEEAVERYDRLARRHPHLLPDLARALGTLDRIATAVGSPERAMRAWSRQLDRTPADAAYLLVCRASGAPAGDPQAVTWLGQATRYPGIPGALLDALHTEARRHRAVDSRRFDDTWPEQPVPDWLSVDEDLLTAARAWAAAATDSDAASCLAAHPELLDPVADTAVAEALLAYEYRDRSRLLRQAAREHGVEPVYGPLLRAQLAAEFAEGSVPVQRGLLAERRAELLAEDVRRELRQHRQSVRVLALVDLAVLGAHEPVLDALADPAPADRFAELLQAYATAGDVRALGPAAVVAGTVPGAGTASAMVYQAVARTVEGDHAGAAELIRGARDLDPGRVTTWLAVCAAIAQRHPAVLPLLVELADPGR